MTPIQQVLSEFSGPLTGNPDAVTSLREWQIKAMVEEIERLKEVEKERDEARNIIPDCAKEIESLRDQLSQLRTAYKEALEALNRIYTNDEHWIGGIDGTPRQSIKGHYASIAKQALTNPLAIEVMKEKKGSNE